MGKLLQITWTCLFFPDLIGVSARLEYGASSHPKFWYEGQHYCREHWTDLVTINSMEEYEKILKTTTSGEKYWTGLMRGDTTAWHWSLADPAFYGPGGQSAYRNWTAGEPSGEGNDCVQVSGGYWSSITCTNTRPFVCYDAMSGDNTLISEPKTWREAQHYCREHHTDLASVRSTAENRDIHHIVADGTAVWIGLFRDHWGWSDGSSSSFRVWGAGQPVSDKSSNRVLVSARQMFNVREANHYFLCYKDSTPSVPTSSTGSSSVPTSESSSVPTSESPSVPTSESPSVPTSESPSVPTSESPSVPTSESPSVPTSESPSVPTSESSSVPTSESSSVPTSESPSVPTSESPSVPTSESPSVPTSESPSVPTSESPSVPTSSTEFPSVTTGETKQVLRMKLKVSAGDPADLNDPAVMEAILKQVRDDLKQKGVSGDVKLTWKRQPDGAVFHKETGRKTEL